MTSIPGVDYAWSHPSPASLRAAGKQFACRYLSTDTSKSLSAAEAEALAAAGIASVVVWETTAKRTLDGKTAGAADAKTAAAQAAACGMPDSRPIYFAVDFDATAAQQTAISAYFDGAASVLGLDRVGIYGGYYPVKRTLDAGKATWAWQTIAWSGGKWDTRAVIRQGAQATIGGVSCDLNTALADDYGQWTPGEDMALTPAQAAQLTAVHAAVTTIGSLTEKDASGNPVKHSAGYYLAHIHGDTLAIKTNEAAQTAAITALAGLIGSGVDTAAVVTAVQQAIAAAVVKVDVTVGTPTA